MACSVCRRGDCDTLIDHELDRGGDISPSRLARLRKSVTPYQLRVARDLLEARGDLRKVETDGGTVYRRAS